MKRATKKKRKILKQPKINKTYRCLDCKRNYRTPTTLRSDRVARCQDCQKANDRAVKRVTWHKYKEKYRPSVPQ